MIRPIRTLLFPLAILVLIGCSAQIRETSKTAMAPPESMASNGLIESSRQPLRGQSILNDTTLLGEISGQDPIANQKIIYTGTIRLVTNDFDTFPSELARLASASGGFIAETDVARMQGEQRSGRWVVRIPGKKYQEFIHDVGGLGIPESVQEKADDVTEQFVDLEARVTSGRRLEEQIIKLLEKQNDKIENVLAVERELSRVRLEIEQLEGSLRFLENKVAMSTITIHANEQRTYIPDQAQTLSQRIELTWHRACERFQNFLTNSIVFIVANAFVIPAWIIGLSLSWFLIGRRLVKSWRTTV
jgi:hypothetical protein